MAHLTKDCKMYSTTAAVATPLWSTPRGDNRWRKGHSKQTLIKVMSIRAHTGTWSDLGHAPAIWEAYATATTMMTRLPWLEHLITFDENDQPEH